MTSPLASPQVFTNTGASESVTVMVCTHAAMTEFPQASVAVAVHVRSTTVWPLHGEDTWSSNVTSTVGMGSNASLAAAVASP